MSKDQGIGTELRVVDRVRFISEQDGMPERELKNRLIPLLHLDSAIESAYLARVEYEQCSLGVVALCLRSQRPRESLIREIGAIFASLFGREQSLDVIFIDMEQESEIARVCDPFFFSGP